METLSSSGMLGRDAAEHKNRYTFVMPDLIRHLINMLLPLREQVSRTGICSSGMACIRPACGDSHNNYRGKAAALTFAGAGILPAPEVVNSSIPVK